MNLSPIPINYKKNIKLDEDFFSIEERDLSPDYQDKKVHSLLDIKLEPNENEEEKTDEPKININNLQNPLSKVSKLNQENPIDKDFMEKRRLSRAVESNIVMEMEMEMDSMEKSQKSVILNNSSQKIESSSSPNNSNNSSSPKSKSSYSYSSSSSSVSIENQQKFEINNIIK